MLSYAFCDQQKFSSDRKMLNPYFCYARFAGRWQ